MNVDPLAKADASMDGDGDAGRQIELSIVIPCLNEEDTLSTCIKKAKQAIETLGVPSEIIVADNGSTDGSQRIATDLGVRLVHVQQKGYGAALMGGIAAARGRFIVMGDADDSYDFLEVPKLFAAQRGGYDLVQGCRLPAGGGRVMPGAMPFLHRWWGNPMFTALVRTMFNTSIHDVYCGLRGFTRDMYDRLDMRCTGMEFATEMVIKAALRGERITEVPITLHPDGRKAHTPHLKTFRDGWRTLRFYLMCSPRWLFLMPGLFLLVLGTVGYALAMPGVTVLGARLDAHTLLFSSLFVLLGYQSALFAILTKTFAVSEGLLPQDRRLEKFYEVYSLEWGLVVSAGAFFAGLVLLWTAVNNWRLAEFGDLEYATTMRWVIPGVTLTALAFQTFLFAFFAGILRLHRN